MIGFVIFIIIVIGGFLGLLYYNTTKYGKSNSDYSENNMMYNLNSLKDHTDKIIKEEKEDKEKED